VQGCNARVVTFQVSPEQIAQGVRHCPQGRVVDHELLLTQVVHEQIADRMAGQVVPGDELFGAQLALCGEHAHCGRRLGREHLHRVEQLIVVHARAQAPAELPGVHGHSG
jgi:hypothetical protein